MFINSVSCPSCSAEFIVDASLAEAAIELRCPECSEYFLLPDSPAKHTAQDVCRASVPIRIWRPAP
jgi:predicted Zn finger-like uncharacterized protein